MVFHEILHQDTITYINLTTLQQRYAIPYDFLIPTLFRKLVWIGKEFRLYESSVLKQVKITDELQLENLDVLNK